MEHFGGNVWNLPHCFKRESLKKKKIKPAAIDVLYVRVWSVSGWFNCRWLTFSSSRTPFFLPHFVSGWMEMDHAINKKKFKNHPKHRSQWAKLSVRLELILAVNFAYWSLLPTLPVALQQSSCSWNSDVFCSFVFVFCLFFSIKLFFDCSGKYSTTFLFL